jgi:hypothetical protein
MLLGAAAFGGRDRRALTAAVLGGLAPDVPSFALVLWAGAVQRMPAKEIFETAYFSDAWQLWLAPAHSAPLWLAGLLLALALRARAAGAFAAAGLLHLLCDFPLHADDPHRHFWPLGDWRFESPVSYWDPDRFGLWVQPLEIALGIGLVLLLARRHPGRLPRAGLALAAGLYLLQTLAWIYFLRR